MDSLIFWLLLFAAIPFVLPIVSLVSQGRLRRRVRVLEDAVEGQQQTVDELKRLLRERPAAPPAATAAPPAATVVPPPQPSIEPAPSPGETIAPPTPSAIPPRAASPPQ